MNWKSARGLCTLLALLALSIGASPHTVHAQTAKLANIVIAPQYPVLAVGQSITFTAQGYDQNGSPVPIADPQWKAGNGTITPDPANPSQATFTATEAGSGWVQCSDGPPGTGVHGSTDMTINPSEEGQLVRIDVTPGNLSLRIGDQQQFTATAYDSTGSQVPITPVWSTSGGAVSSGGLYTANTVGDFTVTAGVEGSTVTGTSDIHVLSFSDEGQLVRIDVTPGNLSLRIGDQQQFTATAYDAAGDQVPITPDWTASGGSITSDGLYTAGEEGDFTVTAGVEGSTVTGTSDVHVQSSQSGEGKLARLEIIPEDDVVYIGESGKFRARGYDAQGNQIDITPIWTATGGTIDQHGLFTPGGSLEDAYVTVSVAGSDVTCTTKVTINFARPDPSESANCPDYAPLPPDTSLGLLTLVLGAVYFVQRRFPRP